MKTDLKYIKKLIKVLDMCNVSEIEIEEEGTRIRLVKDRKITGDAPQAISYVPIPQQSAEVMVAQPETKKEEVEVEREVKEEKKLYEVHSPIVGTYYQSPSPEADPYVTVGQHVKPGTVLCIIEAMKLMNEIESEVSGKVVKVLVENGKPVEYNQPLFLIELS